LRFDAEFQMIKDICLGAMAVFTSLLAILATAGFLPKDIEDRTIYTLLSKPVPRPAYLLGKLLGILALLALFILVMTVVFCLVLWSRQQAALAELPQSFPAGDELNAAIARVYESTFNPNLVPGIFIIFVKAALLAALTLLVSSFSTSWLFTVMLMSAIYFIGHLQATAREAWLSGAAETWWTTLLTAAIALLFPDLQTFSLTDDVIAGAAIPVGIFLQTTGLGVVYVAVYYAIGALIFSFREL
jgi:ABC-type Na+ efflux pump permease subunit